MSNHLFRKPFCFAMRMCLLLLIFMATGNASAQNRYALVIGNSEYGSGFDLINPRNDALSIAEKLHSIGYTVHTRQALLDLKLDQFNDELDKFLNLVEDGSSVMIYYAGHGAASQGSNFLIPILPDGIRLRSESDIRNHSVSLEGIVERVETRNPSGVNVFIVDACRDAPVEKFSRSINITGLATLDNRRQPQGSFIGFSTEYGQIAEDGPVDGNSPFATAMLNNLDRRAGLPIELFYKNVGDDVYRTTNGKQFPIQEPKIHGEYCLVQCKNPEASLDSSLQSLGYFNIVSKPADANVCYRVDEVWQDWVCGQTVAVPFGKPVSIKATAGKHKQYKGTALLNRPNQKLIIELERKSRMGIYAGVAVAAIIAGLVISKENSGKNDGYQITLTVPTQ